MAMASTKGATVADDVDDPIRPATRAIPPFPWHRLRRALTLGGDYSGNTQLQPVPTSTRNLTGIRWGRIFESEEYGPVATAVSRAFNDNRARHNLHPAHWNVFTACELGIVERPDTKGMMRWCIYNPARSNAVMPYEEAARAFGIRADLVERYHKDAKRAIEDEWAWLHSGYEG
jgi:hypothetical protein